MMRAAKNRYVLLDRDGVINQRMSGGYVTSWNQFQFLPRVLEGLRLLADHDYTAIILSNQACVGEGLLSSRTWMSSRTDSCWRWRCREETSRRCITAGTVLKTSAGAACLVRVCFVERIWSTGLRRKRRTLSGISREIRGRRTTRVAL